MMCFTGNDTSYGMYFYVEICEMPGFATAKRKLKVNRQKALLEHQKKRN